MSQGTRRTTSSRRHANFPIVGNYDDGKGLQKIWSHEDPANPVTERCCTLRCRGSNKSLRLEIGLFKGRFAKFSRSLFDEVIEKGKNVSIAILSLEMTHRVRITCNKTGRVPSKTVWNLAFLLDTDRKISLCKTSLRKLTNVVANMPSSCISYKNFSNVKTTAVDDQGSLTLERANGFDVTFTGFLGTPAGRRLIGESREDDEPAITTRSGGASQKRTGNVREATLGPEKKPTFAERKAAKKMKKQARKQAKSDAKSLQATSVDGPETENVRRSREAASSKSAAVAGSLSEQDAGPPAGDDDGADSETAWDVEGLEGERVHDGQNEYLVRWSGSRKPSWQPAGNVPLSAIREYYAPKTSGTKPKASATASTTLKRRRSARIEAKELRDREGRAE
ncbi:MAG: hypothetical protein OHK93_001199 [Ramalina farinacea]|uniref:Chromo domain-containing protein n=1 Tax=Ramalina farinacea TaxID=258253 RepID=A0AA43QP24_9LECA|nr:hypothetical protein [Ramalina farinacea]